jgi:hypothetical protein
MKTLIVKSPPHLWSLLIKSDEEIWKSNRSLKRFMSVTENYLKGCQCASNNSTLMNNEYNIIQNDIETINILKIYFGYDEITFENK